MPILNEIKIPRYVFSGAESIHTIVLHGFSDASEKAYGAVVYIRSIDNTGTVCSHLAASKSRVAPLKKQSIPRLELCAALLLAELINKFRDIVTSSLDISRIRLWSDSTVTLCWIRTPAYRLQTFEANRVQKIQNLTKNCPWDYVNTLENPADLISKGMSPSDLKNSNLWWHGPKWLVSSSDEWSDRIDFIPSEPLNVGLKRSQHLILSVMKPNDIFTRYSSYTKLLRVVAYMYRFIINTASCGPKLCGCLEVFEIENALMTLIKLAQLEAFPNEIKILKSGRVENLKNNSLLPLNPFFDSFGILRVGGRLENARLEFKQKHPIILPRHHALTTLIIRNMHLSQLHAGQQVLKSALRQQFWIIRHHDAVQKCIRNCVKCTRFRAITQEQIMGNLPRERVTPNSLFHITGVDYAGPVKVKCHGGRHKIIMKAYIALFVCFSTKAVHLELIANLSSEAFLNALRRFISRRGKPLEIHSDNGTTFVGAKSTLDRQFKNFLKENKEKIKNLATAHHIKWEFIPTYAPHWGGLWESNIRAMKRHLRTITASTNYNYEEYSTLLCQIEAILNSRPLTPDEINDPDGTTALTPGHFYTGGKPITALPSPDYTITEPDRLKYYQSIQKQVQHFWRRWSSEYLHTLQQRSKWRLIKDDLKVGDFVLVKRNDLPPLHWAMGRVSEVHPGADNRIRLVSLRTANGYIKQPITNLIYLPVNENYENRVASEHQQFPKTRSKNL